MDMTVETSNMTPRSTLISMKGRGKGVLDGKLVGNAEQLAVESKETKVMIGWSGIQ